LNLLLTVDKRRHRVREDELALLFARLRAWRSAVSRVVMATTIRLTMCRACDSRIAIDSASFASSAETNATLMLCCKALIESIRSHKSTRQHDTSIRPYVHLHPPLATRHLYLFFADLLNSFGSISRFRFAITGFALATAATKGGGGAVAAAAVVAVAAADAEPDKLDGA
jgi:hypothetical protein